MSIGRLIQPATVVRWGSLELSSWDYGDNHKRPVVFDVTVDLKAGNNQVNKASMKFDPSPVGFAAYTECVGSNLESPISIRFGYENGSYTETVFFFQNVDFVTGKSQDITVHLAGKQKNLLTSHWWNEYISDGIEEIEVKDLFTQVISKAGLTPKITPEAEKVLGELPPITKAIIHNQTVGNFLVNSAEKYGLILEYPSGSEGDNEVIVISTPATNQEELSVKEQSKVSGKIDSGSQRAGQRKGFIIGPTLAAEIKRTTKPFGSVQKNADTAYQTSVKAAENTEEPPNAIEVIASEQGEKPPSGSTSSNKKSNITQCEGLSGNELTECRKKIASNAAAKAKNEYSVCSTAVMMVPYMVGIKPYDFVVFPSLKGDFIEDWEVDSVTYKQQGGAVILSINGKRPQVGQGNLMDSSTLNTFSQKVKSLQALSDWHSYYWNY